MPTNFTAGHDLFDGLNEIIDDHITTRRVRELIPTADDRCLDALVYLVARVRRAEGR